MEALVNGCWINELINKLNFMICMIISVIFVKFHIECHREEKDNTGWISVYSLIVYIAYQQTENTIEKMNGLYLALRIPMLIYYPCYISCG